MVKVSNWIPSSNGSEPVRVKAMERTSSCMSKHLLAEIVHIRVYGSAQISPKESATIYQLRCAISEHRHFVN